MKNDEMFTTILHLTPTDPQKAISLMKNHFQNLSLTSQPDTPAAQVFYHAVQLTRFIKQKKYEKAFEISKELITKYYHIQDIFQEEYDYYNIIDKMYSSSSLRHFDFPLSLILLSFYNSFKKIYNTQNTQIFFLLLNINKEINNLECVSALSVIILDILVKNKMYKESLEFIDKCKFEMKGMKSTPLNVVDDEHKMNISNSFLHLFFYFKGISCLFLGYYILATESFHISTLLTKNGNFIAMSEKYLIISYLQVSDLIFLKQFKWRKELKCYYKIYSCLKTGCSKKFFEILECYRDMYINDGVYFLIRRIWARVMMEGLRKIGLVYNKISVQDISILLETEKKDVKFLIMKGIKSGTIDGYLENDFLVIKSVSKYNVGYKVKEALEMGDVAGSVIK